MLAVPYPVSANRYWRHSRGRHHHSSEAKAYRAKVQVAALEAGLQPMDGPVGVRLCLRPKMPKDWRKRGATDPHWVERLRCIDLDNAGKVLIDALQGFAWHDDAQLRQIQMERGMPQFGGGVEVAVWAVEPVEVA